MSKSKKKSRSEKKRTGKSGRGKKNSQRASTLGSNESPLSVLLKFSIGLLIVARLLVPTESTTQGGTLWLTQLWLAVGLIWFWDRLRERDFRIRLDRLDALLWLVVVGHVVSALVVLFTQGDKRAAINGSWEWVGLGVSFFLMKQIILSSIQARRLTLALVAAAMTLSALGLWQHYVFYPQTAAMYQQIRGELDELQNSTSPLPPLERQQRLNELQLEFVEQGIPLEGTERALWEDRLRSSTEPFGRFALANTFAGWLTVWLIAAVGMIAAVWKKSQQTHWSMVALVGIAVIIAFCLILTKSRTAFVGLAAGAAMWGGLYFLASWKEGRRTRIAWIAAAGLVLVGLVTAAGLSGGLDRQVISEAPKSLQYRLQYWQATWEVLRENPVFGTGPGNFRQHYLKHKLPESSEEIVDPHNVLLDVWANGGLIGLAGLIGLIGAAAWGFYRSPSSSDRTTDPPGWDATMVGAAISFLVVFAVEFLLGEGLDYQLLALLAVWLVTMVGLGKISSASSVSNVCLLAGIVALLVHLLGAGGIEMPAIVQTFLVLLVLATVSGKSDGEKLRESRIPTVLAGSLFSIFFVACFMTATMPVLIRQAKIRSGDAIYAQTANHVAAMRDYTDAAEADPFSSEAAGRLADLTYRNWETLPSASDDFDRAVELQRVAIDLDPLAPNGYRRLGEWFQKRFELTRSRESAIAATEAFQAASERYPNNALLRSLLAKALESAGKDPEALEQARIALDLDAINRAEGHSDKYLSPQRLQALRSMGGRNPHPDSAERN